ncbi:universal stress protein [Dactylosporangium sp. NPDC005555]|uniref:sensor histidine kinase n=1 Tax=Dactylosporangium sp. NPDC005555 TaxID=3154889 RepID=UPI0033A6FDAF
MGASNDMTGPAGAGRGRLRIYLGAAPGVGKTYAMLQEGLRRRAEGADVVIGVVEPHGRKPIAVMAEDLETVPRRSLTYRGSAFAELDLDGILARHPQVALVDELAHTNVPGCRNTKRWQDVEELLAAGIDVATTLNVQHLESLNDTVQQITGTVQRETLPDAVARRADQIELVDLSTEALRRRMVHGDIYPPDRIESALTHYFRPGNLTALRELALLWVADRVDEGLQNYRAEHGIAAPWEARERILVGVTGDVGGETIIRRAARIAARMPGCELIAVHVTTCSGLIGADPAALVRQRVLVESLGGSYWQVVGDDVAQTLLQLARAQNATQIVLGVSRRGGFAGLLSGEDVAAKVVRLCGPVNVHTVTHEGAAGPPRLSLPRLTRDLGPHRRWYAFIVAAVLLPALTMAFGALRGELEVPVGLALYLLAVLAVALVGGLYPALAAALAAGLLASYLLPQHAPTNSGLTDAAVLAVFVAAGSMFGLSVELTAGWARRAAHESAQASTLSHLAVGVLRGQDSPAALLEQLRQTFGLRAVSLLERLPDNRPGADWYVAASAGWHPPERPEGADVTAPVAEGLTIAGVGRMLSADEQRILTAYVAHLTDAFNREVEPRPTDAVEHLHGPLVAAIPDLRAALAAAETALTDLTGHACRLAPSDQARYTAAAQASVGRTVRLLTDLDDLCRLRAGALDCRLRPVDLTEAIDAAIDDLGPDGQPVTLRLPDRLPCIVADSQLLTHSITSLAADALRRSPPHSPPTITAIVEPQQLQIQVIDHGSDTSGLDDTSAIIATPPLAPMLSPNLARRVALGLAEAMGGALRQECTPGGGLTVTITLPTADCSRRTAEHQAGHAAASTAVHGSE